MKKRKPTHPLYLSLRGRKPEQVGKKLFWRSNVEWPPEVNTGRTPNVSTDDHDSRSFAEGICRVLQREGLGGQGKIFPIRTWVSEEWK